MIEKVNPQHPDKVADRIAGAIVDLAYTKEENPKVAVEVLIGHGKCHIIAETSVDLEFEEVDAIVKRIAGNVETDLVVVPQDKHLAENQSKNIRCGDNGIFKGVPLTAEEKELSRIARYIYSKYEYDGKYILDNYTGYTIPKLIICQSNAKTEDLRKLCEHAIINPLGDWTGGTDVDTGATNRKLGSDMAQSVTGGGLHGMTCQRQMCQLIFTHLKKHKKQARLLNYAVLLAMKLSMVNLTAKSWKKQENLSQKLVALKSLLNGVYFNER